MNGSHVTTYPFGHVTYWRGDTAVGETDDWDSAKVFGPHSLGVASFVATSSAELRRIVHFGEAVHQRGAEDLGKQICKLIGVKPWR